MMMRWPSPEKIRLFLWRVVNNGLLTNAERSRRGLGDARCHRCSCYVEDLMHVLRDCYNAKRVSLALVTGQDRMRFFTATSIDWVRFNLSKTDVDGDGIEWRVRWGVTAWMLWNWRNKELFMADFFFPLQPICLINRYVRDIHLAVPLVSEGGKKRDCQVVNIGWKCPDQNWVTLNCDGSVNNSLSKAGCGGLLRDSRGRWISGFCKNLGSCGVLEAEAWGVLEGLRIAWDSGYRNVILEVDSKVLATLLNSDSLGNLEALRLIRQCFKWLKQDWQVQVKHIYREGNKCAD